MIGTRKRVGYSIEIWGALLLIGNEGEVDPLRSKERKLEIRKQEERKAERGELDDKSPMPHPIKSFRNLRGYDGVPQIYNSR